MKPAMRAAVACLVAALVAAAAPARAQLSESWRLCIEATVIAPARAIGACTALLETVPPTAIDRAMVFNIRGVAYKRAGDYEHALADYGEAIRLAPEFPGFHINRGKVHYITREYERAIADFDQALRLSPGNAAALYRRGLAKLANGDPGGAADIAAAKAVKANLAPVDGRPTAKQK